MMTLRVLLFLSVSVCTINLFAQASIPNGDFKSSKNGKLTGWRYVRNVSKEECKDLPGQEYCAVMKSGVKELSSNHGVRRKYAARLAQRIKDLEPGKKLTVSFYAKGSTEGHFFVIILHGLKHGLKAKKIYLSKAWKKYSFSCDIPEVWNKCDIMFNNYHGTVDLSGISFKTSAPEKANKKAKIATGLSWSSKRKNILINPSFELGWQGWVLNHFTRVDSIYRAKPTFDYTIKHSGLCSLKLSSYDGVASLRYNMNPDKIYTLSFYARGEADINNIPSGKQTSISLFHHSWKGKTIRLNTLTKEWKRYSITTKGRDIISTFRTPKFNPKFEDGSFSVRVLNFGPTIWLDSFQLEEGAKATPYASNIDIGYVTNKPNAIYPITGDNAAKVKIYHPKGLFQTMELQCDVVDIYGKNIWHKKYSLSPTKKFMSTIRINIPMKLGVNKINSTLKTNKEVIAKGEWRYFCVDNLQSFKNPMLGVWYSIDRWPLWFAEWYGEIFNIVGADRVKMRIPENKGNRLKSYYNMFKATSKIFQKHGMKVNSLFEPPSTHPLSSWAYRGKNAKDFKEPSKEEDLRWAQEYAKMFVERYSALNGYMDKLNVMNEPNLGRDRHGVSIKPPERMALIYKITRKLLNKQLGKKFMAGSMNGTDIDFLSRLFKNDAGKYIDEMNFHSYQVNSEQPFLYRNIIRMRTFIDKYNKNISLINGEVYYCIRNEYNFSGEFGANYATSDEMDHAARTVQLLLHSFAAGIKVDLFATRSTFAKYGGVNPVFYFYCMGGIRNVSKLLNGAKSGKHIKVIDEVRTFMFIKPDGTKVVSINTKDIKKKGSMSIPDSCVSVIDFNGNKLKKKTVSLSWLPTYLIFKPEISAKEVVSAMRLADYHGLGVPVEISFTLSKDRKSINAKLINTLQKQVKGIIEIKKTFSKTISFDLKTQQQSSFSIPIPVKIFNWRNELRVNYAIACDGVVEKSSFRLPTIFADKQQGITVDGDLSDWNNASWMKVGKNKIMHESENKYRGADDFNADVALKWNKDYFYIAVKVTDSNKNFGKGVSKFFWRSDSLQIYFDQNNNALKNKGYDSDDTVWQIGLLSNQRPAAWLEKNPSGRYVGENNETTGFDGDIITAFKETSKGYNWEIAIPKTALNLMDMKVGQLLGFGLTIHDKDIKRKSFTLGKPKYTNFRNPFFWKGVMLVKNKK